MAEETAPDLASQYELETSAPPAPTPSASAAPSETPVSAVPAPEAPSTPARDESGRFAKKPHPDYLVKRATDLGMSHEDISALSTSDLRESIRDIQLDRLFSERLADANKSLGTAQAAPSAPAPEPEPELDLSFDENGFDPTLSKFMKLAADQNKRIKQLEARLADVDEIKQHVRAQAGETAAQAIDRGFESLGKDYHKFIGASRPSAGSPEMSRRRAIINEAKILAGGDKAGLNDILANIPKAAKSLYHVEASPAEPAATNPETIKRWNDGMLARPTHREGSVELPGRSKAERTVAEFLRLNGAQQAPTTLEDEFPG